MATSIKLVKSVTLDYLRRKFTPPLLSTTARSFRTSTARRVKKIEVTKANAATVIEGVKLKEDKSCTVRQIKAPTGCPLCEFQSSLTYRDVLILQQFLSPDGKILPRHVTGVCFTMQWKLQNILYQSYSAGLLPNYRPELPVNEDPTHYLKNYKWRKNNVVGLAIVYEHHKMKAMVEVAGLKVVFEYCKTWIAKHILSNYNYVEEVQDGLSVASVEHIINNPDGEKGFGIF